MSDATPILHMLAPQKHMSPFDVNMAADAGYKVIVPYINVELSEITGLIQDAIFSRPPNYGVRTGFFIGGKDAILALDMLDAAKKRWCRRSNAQSLLTRPAHSRQRRRWSPASRSSSRINSTALGKA